MEVSRRTTDGLILQLGSNLGVLPNCEKLILDNTTGMAVQTAFNNPAVSNIFLLGVTTDASGISTGQVQTTAVIPRPTAPPIPNITAIVNALVASPNIDAPTKAALQTALKG